MISGACLSKRRWQSCSLGGTISSCTRVSSLESQGAIVWLYVSPAQHSPARPRNQLKLHHPYSSSPPTSSHHRTPFYTLTHNLTYTHPTHRRVFAKHILPFLSFPSSYPYTSYPYTVHPPFIHRPSNMPFTTSSSSTSNNASNGISGATTAVTSTVGAGVGGVLGTAGGVVGALGRGLGEVRVYACV